MFRQHSRLIAMGLAIAALGCERAEVPPEEASGYRSPQSAAARLETNDGNAQSRTEVAAAESSLQLPDELAPKAAAKLIQEHEGKQTLVVLDVRRSEELAGDRLKDAVHLDFFREDFRQELSKLATDKVYVVYCRSGNRSGKTLALMKELGFSRAHHIAGGITRWSSEGLPVVEKSAAP